MLESVISGIAVPIFEQLWKAGGNLGNKVVGQIREGQQYVEDKGRVLKASREYHKKYEARHGQMKIMPGLMKDPIPLDSIYTAVKFLDDRSRRYFATPDDLEQLYRDQGKRGFQAAGERHDGMSIAKEKQYLMVLGGPGIGKSTFLRKLGLEALKGQEGQLKSNQIPVFLELKTFRNESIDLVGEIAKEFEICGFPDTEAFTAESLKQGKLLLLLDGLDEVPTLNMNRVIEQIEAFATQYDKNTFVTSCRTAAYHSSFNQFSDVTIADFDDEQIEQFIYRWFSSELDQEADTANHYWEQLQEPENQAAKELAQTPLLLTFLCLVYERKQMLPNQRSTLYESALDLLLSEWSAQKRLKLDSIYQGFHPKLEKDLLSEIAYTSFEEDRLFFSKTEITDCITTYLADTLDAPEYLDGPAVLQAIEVQQGILVERATNIYSFSHLTLQEYLTALYVVNNRLILELVNQHLIDQRWREVFLLVIGLMGRRGNELLEAIDQKAKTGIRIQPRVSYLIQWASQIVQDSPSECKKFAKVAIAIAIAIAIDSDFNSSSILAITMAIVDNHASEIIIESARNIAINIAKVSVRIRDIVNEIDSPFNVEEVFEHKSDFDIDCDIAFSDIAFIIFEDPGLNYSDNDRIFNNNELICSSERGTDIERAIDIDSDIDNAVNSAIEFTKCLNQLKIFNTSEFNSLPGKLLKLKGKMPQPSASANEWISYADELEEVFPMALGLSVESISLSKEEWNCVHEYLYAYELLLSCQRSAIGMSRKAWELLEVRLLMIA
ncbi:NACHT domain-containing protein [Leptothoe sp. EHU-05/26/07-4]